MGLWEECSSYVENVYDSAAQTHSALLLYLEPVYTWQAQYNIRFLPLQPRLD